MRTKKMKMRMRRLLFSLAAAAVLACGFAQKPYKVMFYNLENLFDTINDPATLDDEFTPEGAKGWDAGRYATKLANVERVIGDLGRLDGLFPAVIGVAEVETRATLEELAALPGLAAADYRVVHYDSPEARGVDVAFLYRPDCFELAGSAPVRTVVPELPDFRTRDILTMWGTLAGEPFYFMVIHWPSRRGGSEASAFKRIAVGEQMRRMADSVLRQNPATKIVAMGDFNDDPIDRSLTEALGARGDVRQLCAGDLYNPFVDLFKAGYGTLAYNGAWNLFDNIVVTENLLRGDGVRLRAAEGSEFTGNIFSPPYLIQQTGRYRGYPLRTYVGNTFCGGYSDHFPVYIYLE